MFSKKIIKEIGKLTSKYGIPEEILSFTDPNSSNNEIELRLLEEISVFLDNNISKFKTKENLDINHLQNNFDIHSIATFFERNLLMDTKEKGAFYTPISISEYIIKNTPQCSCSNTDIISASWCSCK